MRNLLAIAVIPFLASACLDLGLDFLDRDVEDIDWDSPYQSNVNADSARLDGRMGDVSFAEADEAWVNVAMVESDYAWFDIRNDGPGGTGMAMLNLYFDIQDLEPGMVLHGGFDPESWDESEPMMIDLVGCSGDVEDEWEYDEPAEDVEIVVEDSGDEDSVLLSWTGNWPNGDVSTGQVRIELARTN